MSSRDKQLNTLRQDIGRLRGLQTNRVASGGAKLKHLQVQRHLKEAIIRAGIRPGHRLPDERELADRYGVSRVTIRQALSALAEKGVLVRERKRGTTVVKIPDEYEDLNRPFHCTLDPNGPLVFPSVDHVNFLVPYSYEQYLAGIASHVFFELANGLRDELLVHKIVLNVITIREGLKQAAMVCEKARDESKCHGMIYLQVSQGAGRQFVDIAKQISNHLPRIVLSWSHYLPTTDFNCVCCNDEPGGYAMAQHVLALGHRRIACICILCDEPEANTSLRYWGWRKGMMEGDVELIDELIVKQDGSTSACAYKTMQELLQLPASRRPTAVCCMNDAFAIGAMEAIKEHGLHIPRDIAVIGFDDMPLARHTNPPLTTVKKHRYQLGQEAIRMLIDVSRGMDAQPLYKVLEPNLVVRESSVAPLARNLQEGRDDGHVRLRTTDKGNISLEPESIEKRRKP